MKLSIFTSMTNPQERNDPWEEGLECYEDFADEVIIVGETWPQEFTFSDIGKVFQEGFDRSNGDWVILMDIDTFFHENDTNFSQVTLIRTSFLENIEVCVEHGRFSFPLNRFSK